MKIHRIPPLRWPLDLNRIIWLVQIRTDIGNRQATANASDYHLHGERCKRYCLPHLEMYLWWIENSSDFTSHPMPHMPVIVRYRVSWSMSRGTGWHVIVSHRRPPCSRIVKCTIYDGRKMLPSRMTMSSYYVIFSLLLEFLSAALNPSKINEIEKNARNFSTVICNWWLTNRA